MGEIARDVRRAPREGPEGLQRRQRARLAELVAFARANSPYYRELYQDLPQEVEDPALLPVTGKKQLMARFDDWVTDREVTRERVEEFVADPGRAGAHFQGKYLVATTSGTSGLRGLFVLDERSIAVATAVGARARAGLGFGGAMSALAHGGRTAVVASPGGHFSTAAASFRFQRDHPRLAWMLRIVSINQPLSEMSAQLNAYNPASVAGFSSVLTLLAGEQEAGRLRIHPAMVIAGGEALTPDNRARIGAAFGATVRGSYAATECGYLTFGCDQQWFHVNTDWAVLEAVDADHQPVAPGEPSHTVLISNLANRVQPIIRYDLGDSVTLRPDPCPCGSPLPAIRVQGRAAELLTFPDGRGGQVSLSPMLFGTVLDRVAGVRQFQLVQSAPATLRVRLRAGDEVDAESVWETVLGDLTRLLAEHKAGAVALERAQEAPEQSPGGKFRRIIPLPGP